MCTNSSLLCFSSHRKCELKHKLTDPSLSKESDPQRVDLQPHPDPKPPSPMSRHSRTPAELLSPPMPSCFTAAHYCIFLIIIIIPSESVCLFQYKNTNQSFIQLTWSCSYRASFCRKILCLQELVHWFGNNNRQLSGASYDPGDLWPCILYKDFKKYYRFWFYYNE